MSRVPLVKYLAGTRRVFFTTAEIVALSGKSPSTVVQGLRRLETHGVIVRIYRGIWAHAEVPAVNPYEVIPLLLPAHRVYLSFLSALHLHGMIGQVPRIVTLASTAHSRTLRTALGVFAVHRIDPGFFWGFDWHLNAGGFLVAAPEKALLDCLYLAGRRGKRYAYFPELTFHSTFSFGKARQWARRIRDPRLRAHVLAGLEALRRRPA